MAVGDCMLSLTVRRRLHPPSRLERASARRPASFPFDASQAVSARLRLSTRFSSSERPLMGAPSIRRGFPVMAAVQTRTGRATAPPPQPQARRPLPAAPGADRIPNGGSAGCQVPSTSAMPCNARPSRLRHYSGEQRYVPLQAADQQASGIQTWVCPKHGSATKPRASQNTDASAVPALTVTLRPAVPGN